MIDKPYERYTDNGVFKENGENIDDDYNYLSYDYNLTAKLGGNYSKIIEFYDSKL